MINVSLGGFLLLFLARRLLYLILIDPSYLLYSSEELYRGTIAQELVTGLAMPFTEYRADNYSGGSLVIGALAAGFFRLFGPTVFALKLAPLLMFTLALVCWYWTIQRAAGDRVARYFAVLFCFPSPLFTAFSVAAMGFHSESIFFSALTVFLLFRMLSQETPSLVYPVLLGLTAGFGLWFTYIYGLTILAMLGFWLCYDKGRFWRPRFACFALGFVVGFSPWIVMNMQTHFAGLVVQGKNVWEHFGLTYLLDGLTNPRQLTPYDFFANIASDDPRDLPRRAVNLLYALLYLGPILTAGVLRLMNGRSDPAGPRPTRPTLVGFAILYLVICALAVQFSDFKDTRFHAPAYPFLFLLVADSLARCQDLLPHFQRQIQTVFLASVVVLGLGTHAPLSSLDRAGSALFAKGYSYAWMPVAYLSTHGTLSYTYASRVSWDHNFFAKPVERPLLSDILSKLSSDDQRELSRGIAWMLADAVPFNGQEEDFARLERVVPPGLDGHFYYWFGGRAMARYPNELPKAVAAVELVHHRTPALHHLALIGIYQAWPKVAPLDRTPESLVNSPAGVAPELSTHYWRALGYLAGRSWDSTDRSLSLLNSHLQMFVPRLAASVQRPFLQGVGEWLFTHFIYTHGVPQPELERFPSPYQEGLLEGWGMALGEDELFPRLPWRGQESPNWTAWAKGLSARSIAYIEQGKAQFDALFEAAAPSTLEPPLSQ